VTNATVVQRSESQELGHDRATTLRLGQLFVLAAGVVLVLVVAGMCLDLVRDLLDDAVAAAEPAAAEVAG